MLHGGNRRPHGQEALRTGKPWDWFRRFAVLREPCELGPRLEGGLYGWQRFRDQG